jgi:hypothetical protein
MAIKHLTYQDIPRSRRRAAASRAATKMREMLYLNPALTDDQRAAIEGKIKHLKAWTDGKLDPGDAPVMIKDDKGKDKKPKHHEVVIEEELVIDESGGE